MLTREAAEIIPNSRYVTAQNASGKGITAIIDKENDTTILRLGAVPQARGAVCCVNEIGRMDYEDQGFLLDVMEEGSFTVDKYAIHLRIKSATTIIATANPTGMRWNDPFKISNSEIPVLGTLWTDSTRSTRLTNLRLKKNAGHMRQKKQRWTKETSGTTIIS